MVKSPVVFQCFTRASLMVVCENAGITSASVVNRSFIVKIASGYNCYRTHARRATPGDIVGSSNRPLPSRGGPSSMATRSADRYFELKSEIHRKLIGVLNLE